MDQINKLRIESITFKEELCLSNILGNKTFPKELIPALNINNYINPLLSIGNGDDVGWTGYLQQNSLDYMLGGITNTPSNAGALKPQFIYGNTPQAYSTKTISKTIITNGGSGYTSAPTVIITGDGSGAVGYAILNAGQISEIRISQGGQNYTNAAITITGGGGTGATATAYIGSGQISSNLIYVEPNSIFSKLSPDGTYIGTEFYTKAQSNSIVPNTGYIPNSGVSLHNQTTTPNAAITVIANKIFSIKSSKIGIFQANIQIAYGVFNPTNASDNVTLELIMEVCNNPVFAQNVYSSSKYFTLKNNRYGGSSDFNNTAISYQNLTFLFNDFGFMTNTSPIPKDYYFRVSVRIASMTSPQNTNISVQSDQTGIFYTLSDPANFNQY